MGKKLLLVLPRNDRSSGFHPQGQDLVISCVFPPRAGVEGEGGILPEELVFRGLICFIVVTDMDISEIGVERNIRSAVVQDSAVIGAFSGCQCSVHVK